MAHMALTNSAIEAIVPTDVWYETDPSLRAARHARHLQDIPHAIELYLQVSKNPFQKFMRLNQLNC